MTDWFYPTGFSFWEAEEREAIQRVISSGWFTYGPEVEAFEREVAEFHGRKYAVMCNSGSSANWLAVTALFHKKENPLRRGDQAIVPAIAWATTFNPLVQNGLELIIKDVGPSWNAEWNGPNDNRSHNGVRLVVTCPVLGNPVDYRAYERILHGWNWDGYWIDDACESVGSWIGPLGEKRYAGSFGIMSTISLFMSHQISAVEGGVVLTDDEECYRLCRILRNHGWTRDVEKSGSFDDEYQFVFADGMNLRPVEMHAAIAREQLKKLEKMCMARQANWNNWELLCHGLPIQIPPKSRVAVRSPFGLNFTCESKEARARLVKAFRENGIDCSLPTGGSFRKHPYAAQWADQKTPNADRIHDTGIFIGNAPYEIAEKIGRAVKIMRETL